MDVIYKCRHCGTKVGHIEANAFRTNDLGFDQLTAEERKDMIQYDDNGHIHVSTICEDCQEALERNPEFHQWDTFIQ
ncbi:uncharacterized protein DUF2757 [Scopulibacillus darangshiensis]|uniref:Uncharacterized protein DUF2757 n=1 Tax=Scopulibacillus darangshiensis TaxID=442528 RepID=A0A4R2NLN7_9BACL|nr:anti-sigma-F factor Fin family protein [Scopulibacillus darangshiensis]TCP22543.1 uncharacterized protein DUF2757 [Scopulibacillus darangshiensis]